MRLIQFYYGGDKQYHICDTQTTILTFRETSSVAKTILCKQLIFTPIFLCVVSPLETLTLIFYVQNDTLRVVKVVFGDSERPTVNESVQLLARLALLVLYCQCTRTSVATVLTRNARRHAR